MSFFKMSMQQGNNFTGAVADSAHFILNEPRYKQQGSKIPLEKIQVAPGRRNDHWCGERFSPGVNEK